MHSLPPLIRHLLFKQRCVGFSSRTLLPSTEQAASAATPRTGPRVTRQYRICDRITHRLDPQIPYLGQYLVRVKGFRLGQIPAVELQQR